MIYIPDEIISHILCCLPAETFVRFRIVCKRWKSIIDNDPVLRSQTVNMMIIHDERNYYAIPLYSYKTTSTFRYTKTIPAINIDKGVWTDRHIFATTCHGFLPVTYKPNLYTENCSRRVWALWNPFSGERLHFSEKPKDRAFVSGVGYDVQTDDYKLVLFHMPDRAHNWELHTYVSSLKSGGAWCRVENFPTGHRPMPIRHATFANSALYWLTYKGEVVISLDLSRETYRKLLPLPSCISSHPQFRDNNTRLHALDGCLFLSWVRYNNDGIVWWDIWILQNCDKENGKWNKLMTLWMKNINHYTCCSSDTQLVAYVKSKEEFVIRYEERLIWFDLKNNMCMKTVTMYGFGRYPGQVFPVSLDWLTRNQGDFRRIGKDDRLEVEIETSCRLDSDNFSVEFH